MHRVFLSLAAVASLAACAANAGGTPEYSSPSSAAAAAPAKEAAGVGVYKYLGSRQCQGGGTPLAAMREQLERAGVTVLAASCGSDGRMRPMMCGAADGAIAIIDVPATALPQAATLGFEPLTKLPEASRGPCPSAAGAGAQIR